MDNVMRKIYESQTINMETGEILKSTTVRAGSYNETFLLARTSEGLEWINDFKCFLDLKVFMYLVEFQEPKSSVIIFTGMQIDECAAFFNCTTRSINSSISSLIESKFLKRVARCNYVSSPYTFYKGGTKGMIDRIETWNKIASK